MARAGRLELIIVLNGPLGIGKSTLAEALVESIPWCVMLDGDHLIATNPPPKDEIGYLHSTIALLVEHHRLSGYRHFVINHFWPAAAALAHLRHTLRETCPTCDIRCFLLTLPLDENLVRIQRRQQARVMDEREFERRTVVSEREALFGTAGADLGETFEVSAPPDELVATLLLRVGLS